MQSKSIIRFLLRNIVVGLIIGLVLVFLYPSLEHREDGQPHATHEQALGGQSYADAVAIARPAVANIYSRKIIRNTQNPLLDSPLLRRFFGDALRAQPRDRIASSLGSGVLVDPRGYLLTNHHVIANADQVLVALPDGRSANALLVGSDPDTDLAVLRIDLPNLSSITMGTSENLRVGDVVLAIGNPFGVGQTVTMGIVSATGRQQGIATFEDFIQTDAAINPGNSGGALINTRGELVGINTAIFSRSGGSLGIGFAIPSQLASHVLKQILAHGEVIRGWLGIEVQEITPEMAESLGVANNLGVVVTGVYRDSPAQASGIRAGDLITHLNGDKIMDPRETLYRIARLVPGEKVQLRILRGGTTSDYGITISKRPTAKPG